MKTTGLYPRVHVDTAKVTAVAQAGGVLLTETIRAAGLDRGLSEALAGWRKPLAVHDPGKILLDLAVSLALGGDALSDVAVLRGEPGVYGPVASDPTGRRVLVRADGAGGTKEFTKWLTGRRVAYSVGFTLPMDTAALYHEIPEWVWLPALNADGDARDGADLAEFTWLLNLSGWPKGMRVIVRRERPHPGAQLRFDDVDGYRLTAFATNTRGGTLQQLELRHRRRARCEDRIRQAKTTGLANLPLHGFDQNRIWCQIIALASELQAWTGMLALAGHEARRWEPKRLRYRLFSVPATIARRARRTILHLSDRSPWAGLILAGITRLQGLPAPAT